MQRLIPKTGCSTLDTIFQETDRYLSFMESQGYSLLKPALAMADLPLPIPFLQESEATIQEEISSHREFVRQHLTIAQLTLDETLSYIFEQIGLQPERVQDSIALYDPRERRTPIAKLVIDPGQPLDNFHYEPSTDVIYMKPDEKIYLSNGRVMREEKEELMVLRVGKVYYLPDGTVVLARTKKNWSEKIVRVMYSEALGQRKGFRDLAACMILDKGDRRVEKEVVRLIGLELRKNGRDNGGEKPINQYYTSKIPVPLEVLALSFDTFERMETGDLSHEKYFKPRINREIDLAAVNNQDLALAWIILNRTCDMRHIAPQDVYMPLIPTELSQPSA